MVPLEIFQLTLRSLSFIERFSVEFRKKDTDDKGPIRIRRKCMWLTRTQSAGKRVRACHDWLCFYFWLDNKVARPSITKPKQMRITWEKILLLKYAWENYFSVIGWELANLSPSLFNLLCSTIGHFQVLLCLCFKASLSAKPCLWKWVLHAVSFSCKSKSVS